MDYDPIKCGPNKENCNIIDFCIWQCLFCGYGEEPYGGASDPYEPARGPIQRAGSNGGDDSGVHKQEHQPVAVK